MLTLKEFNYVPTFNIKEQNFKLGDKCHNVYSGKTSIVTEKTLQQLEFCNKFAYGHSYLKNLSN